MIGEVIAREISVLRAGLRATKSIKRDPEE